MSIDPKRLLTMREDLAKRKGPRLRKPRPVEVESPPKRASSRLCACGRKLSRYAKGETCLLCLQPGRISVPVASPSTIESARRQLAARGIIL